MGVRFALNGRVTEVEGVAPHVSLLAFLRERGLVGSKEACAEGECGACAVAIGARGPDGVTRYQAVNGCLVPLFSVDERAVITVEGIAAVAPAHDAAGAHAALHPVQSALVEQAASQCGYCTPGFAISLLCAYHEGPAALRDPDTIAGNLCRCTGYRPIVAAQAALAASVPPSPRRLPQLAAPPPRAHSADARVQQPRSLSEALRLWAAEPEATLMAGATDLMVEANQRGRRFARVISLEHVAELCTITRSADALSLGAALPLALIEAAPPPEFPVLGELLARFASRLIRRRATLGGNLGTASPIGDAAPVLLALDAELVLASARGERRLPLRQFFTGYRRTARSADELITAVVLPLPPPSIQRFYKVAKRSADDIASVAAAFALTLDAQGRVERLGMAYGGIAATPLCAEHVEALGRGEPWDAATQRRLREALAGLGTPQSDQRASAAYRRAMITSLFDKFCSEHPSGEGGAP